MDFRNVYCMLVLTENWRTDKEQADAIGACYLYHTLPKSLVKCVITATGQRREPQSLQEAGKTSKKVTL